MANTFIDTARILVRSGAGGHRQQVIGGVQTVGPLGALAEVVGEDIQLPPGLQVAAPGELLPQGEHLQGAVPPADVQGIGGGRLGSQGRHHGKTVIGPIGKCPAGLSGQDQGVELSVGLQRTAPVDAGDVPVRQEKGLGRGDVRVVQSNRPVSHHHPPLKAVPLVEKRVVFHTRPGAQGL